MMDSVAAVMTQVMRESRDPGPGPYGKAAAKPRWEAGGGVGERCEWHRLTHCPTSLQDAETLSTSPGTPPRDPLLCLPTQTRPHLSSKWGNMVTGTQGSQPSPVLLFLVLCVCFLFPRTQRSSSTESTHHLDTLPLETHTKFQGR